MRTENTQKLVDAQNICGYAQKTHNNVWIRTEIIFLTLTPGGGGRYFMSKLLRGRDMVQYPTGKAATRVGPVILSTRFKSYKSTIIIVECSRIIVVIVLQEKC